MSREIDKRIAVEVMGLKCPAWVSCGRGQFAWELTFPNYSTNIADAWLVVENMQGMDCFFMLDDMEYMVWQAQFERDEIVYGAKAECAPKAICLAALRVTESK